MGWLRPRAAWLRRRSCVVLPYRRRCLRIKPVPTTNITVGGDGTRAGWTAGAGIDYAITNNWFTGVEYRYSQYQASTFIYPIPILNLGLVGFKHELNSNQVNARLGYKF